MEIRIKGKKKDLRDLFCGIVGCKPKVRTWVVETEAPDEPIPKGPPHMATVRLSKPIKPGFRRKVNLRPDEPLDKDANGAYARVEQVEGDATVEVRSESTAEVIKLYVNGNGALGDHKVRVLADGHIGEGEATISLDVSFQIAHQDATAFSEAIEEEAPDEKIPAPPSPEPAPAGGGGS